MASRKVQVLVTTHSPEILSHKGIRPEHILSVSADSGETVIAPVTPANRSAIEDRLYSAGELLVQGQLEPDREAASRAARQLPLFSDGKE